MPNPFNVTESSEMPRGVTEVAQEPNYPPPPAGMEPDTGAPPQPKASPPAPQQELDTDLQPRPRHDKVEPTPDAPGNRKPEPQDELPPEEVQEEPEAPQQEEPEEDEPPKAAAAKDDELDEKELSDDELDIAGAEPDPQAVEIDKMRTEHAEMSQIISSLTEIDPETQQARWIPEMQDILDRVASAAGPGRGMTVSKAKEEYEQVKQTLKGEVDDAVLDAAEKLLEARERVANAERGERAKIQSVENRYKERLQSFADKNPGFRNSKVQAAMARRFAGLYGGFTPLEQKQMVADGRVSLQEVYELAKQEVGYKRQLRDAKERGKQEAAAMRSAGTSTGAVRAPQGSGGKQAPGVRAQPRTVEDLSDDEYADAIVGASDSPVTNTGRHDPLQEFFSK